MESQLSIPDDSSRPKTPFTRRSIEVPGNPVWTIGLTKVPCTCLSLASFDPALSLHQWSGQLIWRIPAPDDDDEDDNDDDNDDNEINESQIDDVFEFLNAQFHLHW